jgi:hypothetical protein
MSVSIRHAEPTAFADNDEERDNQAAPILITATAKFTILHISHYLVVHEYNPVRAI